MRVDIYGFFGHLNGWGTHCRNIAFALARHHEIRAIGLDGRSQAALEQIGTIPHGQPDPAADVALCIGPASNIRMLRGRYRIACFVWETTRISAEQKESLLDVDEIWVPSQWGREILVANGIPAGSIHIVPEGVDTERFVPEESRPAGPFRFLFLGKWEERKCPAGLVRCYQSEFSPDEKVELVLHAHTNNPRGFSVRQALLDMRLDDCAPIGISEPLPAQKLAMLYRACDAFVLPTRAEGWGLPIVEAMASGLPTIASACSAQLDYLNEGNGFPTRVASMVPVRDPVYFDPAKDWGEWAEPDWKHLASTMRHVFENRDEARSRGAQARVDVVSRWTWDHAAVAASERLAALTLP